MSRPRFANRPGEREHPTWTTMRLAITGLTLASAAAYAFGCLAPAQLADAALRAAGLPIGEAARVLAFAWIPAIASALCVGASLRAAGAPAASAFVGTWPLLAAAPLALAAPWLPAGVTPHLVASSANGLLALVVLGLAPAALCSAEPVGVPAPARSVPSRPAAIPRTEAEDAAAEPVALAA